jgi:hypothetical protein
VGSSDSISSPRNGVPGQDNFHRLSDLRRRNDDYFIDEEEENKQKGGRKIGQHYHQQEQHLDSNGNEVMQGFLLKKTQNFLLGWQRKFCLIRDCKFKYFKDKEMQKLGGVFDFENIDCKISIDHTGEASGHKFKIEITGSSRVFLFEA